MRAACGVACFILGSLLVSCTPLPPAAPNAQAGLSPSEATPGAVDPVAAIGKAAAGETASLEPVQVITRDNAHRVVKLKELSGPIVEEGYRGAVSSVAIAPSGNLVAAGYYEGGARVFAISTGELHAEFKPETGFVYSVAFSPDGGLLAAGGGRYNPIARGVRVWNVITRQLVLSSADFDESVLDLAFAPDATTLAIAWGHDWKSLGSVKKWDVATGELLDEYSLRREPGSLAMFTPSSIAFSPDGNLMAVAYGDRAVRWNVTNAQPRATLTGCSGCSNDVAFSPDGTLLATAGTAGSRATTGDIRLWDVETGAPLAELEGHEGVVRDVAFGADGKVLASASFDHTVRLWDVETGEALAVLNVPAASAVAFSPDGRLLATAGADPVRLWGVPAPRQERRIENRTPVSGFKKAKRPPKGSSAITGLA